MCEKDRAMLAQGFHHKLIMKGTGKVLYAEDIAAAERILYEDYPNANFDILELDPQHTEI